MPDSPVPLSTWTRITRCCVPAVFIGSGGRSTPHAIEPSRAITSAPNAQTAIRVTPPVSAAAITTPGAPPPRRAHPLHRRLEAGPRPSQGLREHARPSHRGHGVRVAVPPRNQMHVQVPGEPRAGHPAGVDAVVDPV